MVNPYVFYQAYRIILLSFTTSARHFGDAGTSIDSSLLFYHLFLDRLPLLTN